VIVERSEAVVFVDVLEFVRYNVLVQLDDDDEMDATDDIDEDGVCEYFDPDDCADLVECAEEDADVVEIYLARYAE
jgi:hypothetical protein